MHREVRTAMAEQTFENLNFSFLIESEKGMAYLQEWQEGSWSEPDRFSIPLDLAAFPKTSRLTRAVRDFRGEEGYPVLYSALNGAPLEPELNFAGRIRARWQALQAGSRLLLGRVAETTE